MKFRAFVAGLFCEDDAGTVPAWERVFGAGAMGWLCALPIRAEHLGAAEITAFGTSAAAIIVATVGGIAAKAHFGADTVKPSPPTKPTDGD